MGWDAMAEDLYEIDETRDVLIPMADGVMLAANLILPRDAPPVPAIVVYQPYLKDLSGRGAILAWQRHFARRGYACLTVDMRGTGASDGVMAPAFSASEKEDAVVMLDWIARQPWCDGTTGMWGISYSGSSALAAASLKPPSLKAIVPLHGTANEYWGFLNPHGCRPAWWTEASWGPMMILLSLLPPLHRDPGRRWTRVWRERLEGLDPVPFAWHRTPHHDYMAWATDAGAVEAAMYAVSGWHDYYPQATFDYFNAARGPKRILIGEWKHEFPDLAVRGGVDHLGEMDRWWDRWLKGVENGAEGDPPVLVWHQPDLRWRAERQWPPAASTMATLHGTADGGLATAAPGATTASFTVDPSSGLDLLPWDPQAPVVPQPFDRSGDDHRGFVLDGAPVESALDIVGTPEARIALEADVGDFPLHVALSDVRPDGHATLVCQGWVRTAMAAGGPLQAGRPAVLTVPLYATSYRLAAGHRLRMTIAGADFPLLWPAAPNPTITLAFGGDDGTRLALPLARLDDGESPVALLKPPAPPEAGGRHTDRAVNRVERDLDGRTARFTQLEDSSQVLEDGTVVWMERHNWSTVVRDRPEDTVLTSRMAARVERDGDPVAVLVETVQSRESFHVEATIERGGRPFFHKAWDLALDA